ncbi:MAG: 2'-5' RNA ligase family protein [Chloroflexi bacterium]|nr:2'-5' RNA ligase family protein [Chloroflexota bacterium]
MTKSVSPYDQRDDKFGYAVYSVVVFADAETQRRVCTIGDAVAVQRVMMPAHITVKGTFCRIEDLDEVKAEISEIAAQTEGVFVKFEGRANQSFDNSDHQHGYQGINITSELQAFHMKLYESLIPISTLAYGKEGRNYHPHLTVYAEPASGREKLADELSSSLDLGDGFTAKEVTLMGHVGIPYRGKWKIIEQFDLDSA